MFMLDSNPLPLDVPFTHNEIQYPANWLRLASPEERAAIGITEVVEQQRPDDRFYWVTDNGDGTFTAIEKDLEEVRSMLRAQISTTAYTLLAPTDYKIIRSVETGDPVDSDTLTKRTAIRTAYAANNSQITDAVTMVDLASLQFTWPSAG